MDKAYRKKNIACCDERIALLRRRIERAPVTGEDVKDLRRDLNGYADTRARLIKAS